TVLISSHILVELEDICTEIGVIEAGKLVICGNIQEIKHRLIGDLVVEIEIVGEEQGGWSASRVEALLENEPHVVDLMVETPTRLKASFQGEALDVAALHRHLAMAQV